MVNMKDYSAKGKLSLTQMKGGRIPIPKRGGAMKPKKGRGAYTRKDKHSKGNKGWSSDRPFFYAFFSGV